MNGYLGKLLFVDLTTGHMREEPLNVAYAHDFEEQTAPMSCLPDSLSGMRFYEPLDSGLEAEIRKRLERMQRARGETERPPHDSS